MLAIAYGGREASARLRRNAQTVRLGSGLLIGLVALGLVFHVDDHLAKLTPGLHHVPAEQDRGQQDRAARAGEGSRRQGAAEGGQGRTEGLDRPPGLRRRSAAPRRRRLDQLAAARPRRSARQGRADRLLDVLVHQLPAHAPPPEGVVRRLPQGRPRDHRRPHARVRVRARHVERPRGGQAARDHVPGRPGQRLQDLGQLREPVLARRVPDRQDRAHPAPEVRRGLLPGDRAADPVAARCARAAGEAASPTRHRPRR